jgi:hypothetical protein
MLYEAIGYAILETAPVGSRGAIAEDASASRRRGDDVLADNAEGSCRSHRTNGI